MEELKRNTLQTMLSLRRHTKLAYIKRMKADETLDWKTHNNSTKPGKKTLTANHPLVRMSSLELMRRNEISKDEETESDLRRVGTIYLSVVCSHQPFGCEGRTYKWEKGRQQTSDLHIMYELLRHS